MEEILIRHFGRKRDTIFTLSELHEILGVPGDGRTQLQRGLRELERRALVVRLPGGRYLSAASASLVAGRLQLTKSGRGFVTPADPALPEIAIAARETGTALPDDRVLVLLDEMPKKRFWQRASSPAAPLAGSVVSIVERRRSRFVGTFHRTAKGFEVRPDDPRFPRGIAVPPRGNAAVRARQGDKVVVELSRWESRHAAPEGRVVEVLGAPSHEGIDMLGVLRQYDLNGEFPAAVLKEAKRFGSHVQAGDLAGRRDCRAQAVITIDPDDARDFDDAFCLEPAGANRWKLWVHIADVSHYVRPGSALDAEARRRGNSSYLVDRVIPMLPEELSNELCSLKPHVDRLTKCVEFLLSSDGRILATDFYPAVIHSKKRFTYAGALEVLEGRAEDAIGRMLQQAGDLAQAIRKRRFANGSLDLDFPETKIRLDAQGRVSRIERHENDASHQLIEEFMLLANEAVAGRLMKLGRPAIYRTHEAPDPDRLDGYRKEVLGHSIPCGNLTRPDEVRKLFTRLGDLAIGAALKIGFLRSLQRARYTADPIGHYGLAKKKYTHFTSPIRRYADLVVHRSLFAPAKHVPGDALHEVADHLSSTERNSADAERDSKELKLHAFLLDQVHTEKRVRYAARVTALRDFGFSIDIEALGMNAMVPLSLLEDDHYRHDPVAKHIAGRRARRVIRLGDTLEVEIAKVDTIRKMIDFRLAGAASTPARQRTGRRGGEAKGHVLSSRPRAAEGAAIVPDAAAPARRRRRSRRRGKAGAA